MTAALSLSQITHQYPGGITALHDVTLDVPAGQFAALLGPSGCGKSTLLRIAAGLIAPTAGRVLLNAPPDSASRAPVISFVFQDATLMPWASVFDNVWLPLRLRGVSRTDARADVMAQLQAMGLAGFADVFPHALSGGMRMRVSIARALATSPDLLLMDEPFAALDEITRQRLNDDLLALWQSRRFTVVFVTHSVFEAVYLSQRVRVMSARPGQLIAEVAVDKSYPREPLWRTTEDFGAVCRAASAALTAGYADTARAAA
jgi:NitT/TauT family transport system ATP-binding protein